MPITAESLRNGITNGLKGFVCTTLTITDPLEDPILKLYRTAAQKTAPVIGDLAVGLVEATQNYRNRLKRWICDDDPIVNPVPDYDTLFSGGQCATGYEVLFRLTTFGSAGQVSVGGVQGALGTGPISNPRTQIRSVSGFGVCAYGYITFAGTEREVALRCSNTLGYNPVDAELEITQIIRRDGSPDNCGNPPPSIPDGGGEVGGEIDIIGEDENGDPIILPDIPFILINPVFNIDGDIVVDVNFPGLDICGKYRLGFAGEFIPKECIPGSNAPTDTAGEPEGDGTTEPEPDLDENEEDKIPEGKTLKALIVKSQKEVPNISQTQIPTGKAPILLFPRIANVSFKLEAKTEDDVFTAWVQPVDVTSVNAFITPPDGFRVVSWQIQWLPNFKGKAIPILEDYDPCPCNSLPDSQTP